MNSVDSVVISMGAVVICCALGNFVGVLRGKPGMAGAFCLLACAAEVVLAVLDVLGGQWAESAVAVACAAFWFWMWRRSRPKRKRSLRQLGHKARAKLAAMARNMPRPSPRLVLRGARA